MPNPIAVMFVTAVVLAIAGCPDDEAKRLAEMAERNLERQVEQNARNAELHREVAEGTRRLVEADAAAREEIAELHRDIQAERLVFGQQRDQLEADRRDIAAARNRDPIVAEAIKGIGLTVACLVPLLIALQILRHSDQPDEQAAVAELLLNDLTAERPQLIQIRDQAATETREGTPKLNDPTLKRIANP